VDTVHLHVDILPATAVSDEWLTEAERVQLTTLQFCQRRRNEWIRGRQVMRNALISTFGDSAARLSILTDDDGAPRVEGMTDLAISLSHDGDYFAAAIAGRPGLRVGVDLCLRLHERRLRKIFPRLAVHAPNVDVVVAWASLECFLKLRRLGVVDLLDTAFTIAISDNRLTISALGSTVYLSLSRHPQFAVAWGAEAA
jgi:hypothetical protein